MEVPSFLTNSAVLLGALLMFTGVAVVFLTFIGIILSLIFLKTRQVLIPWATLFILNLLEAPIRYLLWIFGIEEDVVSRLIIEVRNILYRDQFDKTPYNQRALFLPQCLRDPACHAPLTPEGIKCLNCGRCGIGKIKDEAEILGYKVFIAPGSSLIKRMVAKHRPSAVLGVGCSMEVKEGTAKMASYGLPVQGVLLERDGCVDTRIEVSKLFEKIKTHHMKNTKYVIGSDEEAMKKVVDISNMWNNEETKDVTVVTPPKEFLERDSW